MNQRLTDKLSSLQETVGKAEAIDAVTTAVVELERLVLKSNYEERQTGGETAPYESRDFEVGAANTRGLSWKLNLFRTIAQSNFCRMNRVGVHGGNVRVLGQPENVDTAIQIYTALVPAFEKVAQTAYQDFADGSKSEDAAGTVNKTGWINQWLINAPAQLGGAIAEVRQKDASANGKIANTVSVMEEELEAYATSQLPAKNEPRAKAEKAPKAPRTRKSKTAAEDPETTGVPEGEGWTRETSSESEDGSVNMEANAEAELVGAEAD